jgi:hypothetical protein
MTLHYVDIENGVVVGKHTVNSNEPIEFTLSLNQLQVTANQYAAVDIGSTYDGQDFTAPPVVPKRVLTTEEFMDRWPVAIQVAIEIASANDPMLRVLMRNLQRPVVHLDSPLLTQGLNYLRANYVGAGKIWPDLTAANAFFATLQANG